jgi:nucleoid-associated protein YgaU
MACLLAAGCRSRTRVAEIPRVDIQIEGAGNRGYLVGTPPAAGDIKTTRKMVETTIELSGKDKGLPRTTPITADELASANYESPAEISDESLTASSELATIPMTGSAFDSYVVQKGDSLWSIASKPDVYGKAGRWREIFDANRDQLKEPGSLQAGMTLKIPRGDGSGSTTYDDQGITVKK